LSKAGEGKMIEMESNHCQVVAESLSGRRSVDERTFASLSVLNERLERLHQLDEVFAGVGFSSSVQELLSRNEALPVA